MKTTGTDCGSRSWPKLAVAVAFFTAMMLDAYQLIPAAHLLRSAHAENAGRFTEALERGRPFSERDIRGPYGFFFQGFVTVALPDGSTLPVPVSANSMI